MQITKAMEMLSAAKLRRAQSQALAALRFSEATAAVLARVAGAAALREHPAFGARPTARVAVGVVASDRGLCGGFNTAVLAAAEARRDRFPQARVELLPIGKRACQALGAGAAFGVPARPRLEDRAAFGAAQDLARRLTAAYAEGAVDRIEFVFTRFISTNRRAVEVRTIFPLPEPPAGRERPYLLEPGPAELVEELLPRYARAQILAILTSSLAAEHAARMLAMGNATRNAQDMIQSLTLTANKVRQAAITKELLEIVGGSAGTS
jgi:F-type H+-transporting ATPase subunit gamma